LLQVLRQQKYASVVRVVSILLPPSLSLATHQEIYQHNYHIQGWSFFTPAFIKGNDFRLFGEAKGVDQTGRRPVQINLEKVLSNQQAYPIFRFS